MKSFALTLIFAAVMAVLSGCGAPAYHEVVVEPRPYVEGPVYVYTYPDGGCWADGIWYAPCRWYTGPHFGYYVYTRGAYVHHPGITWQYRRGYPPPWHHHHYEAPRRHAPPSYRAPSRRGPPPSNHGGGRRF